jgi:hypothetical protein
LFDDGVKDSITDRRVRSRIIWALELHGHHLAPAPGAVMSTIPQNANIPFLALGSSFCAMRLHCRARLWLPLVRLRTGNGVRKNRQFIDIQFAIMILIRKRELLFEKPKYLGL